MGAATTNDVYRSCRKVSKMESNGVGRHGPFSACPSLSKRVCVQNGHHVGSASDEIATMVVDEPNSRGRGRGGRGKAKGRAGRQQGDAGHTNRRRGRGGREGRGRGRGRGGTKRRGSGHGQSHLSRRDDSVVSKTCIVCRAVDSPYKCPRCRQPYCSVPCCQSHKLSCTDGKSMHHGQEEVSTGPVLHSRATAAACVGTDGRASALESHDGDSHEGNTPTVPISDSVAESEAPAHKSNDMTCANDGRPEVDGQAAQTAPIAHAVVGDRLPAILDVWRYEDLPLVEAKHLMRLCQDEALLAKLCSPPWTTRITALLRERRPELALDNLMHIHRQKQDRHVCAEEIAASVDTVLTVDRMLSRLDHAAFRATQTEQGLQERQALDALSPAATREMVRNFVQQSHGHGEGTVATLAERGRVIDGVMMDDRELFVHAMRLQYLQDKR